ncbi:MAG: hypothetical protein HDR09_10010 [Lachnospiraceae bacterium]|nr:hypothetical protein [Lachnospiraceae bacterium]
MRSEKVYDNSSLRTVEIILILTVLIVLIFIFRKKISAQAAFYMGSL